MDLIRLGFQNIRRNKRRTVLNVIALAVGTAIMITSLGWVRGYFTSFYDGIISLDTGHAQILPSGYLDEQRLLPLDLVVTDYKELADELRAVDFVTDVAPRISFGAQIGNGVRSTRMLGRAVDPEHEATLTVVDDHMVSGEYFSRGQGVLLSSKLASRLGVTPGDALFLTATDASGAENFIETSLAGTFSLGYPAIDDNLFFVDLTTAHGLLGMDGVTRLVLGFEGDADVTNELEALRGRVARLGSGQSALQLYGWRTFVGVIVQAVETDIAGFSFIIAVLYLLIIVGILNSMSMAVQERTREIGTLRAIGMRRGQLRVLFLAEGASIAFVGAVVGAFLAAIAGVYLGVVGFDLSALAGTGLPIPFGERFTSEFRFLDVLVGVGIAVVIAVLGTLLPLRRASRQSIAGALGSHLE